MITGVALEMLAKEAEEEEIAMGASSIGNNSLAWCGNELCARKIAERLL